MDEADIPDNVALIFYAQNEGSYIVGQLAAGMSESGVVAVNVGMDTPVIADFVTGFIDGAQAYDPDIKIVKAAVGSWTDPAKMKELCLTQARDKQADVFYQVAGASAQVFSRLVKSSEHGQSVLTLISTHTTKSPRTRNLQTLSSHPC